MNNSTSLDDRIIQSYTPQNNSPISEDQLRNSLRELRLYTIAGEYLLEDLERARIKVERYMRIQEKRYEFLHNY